MTAITSTQAQEYLNRWERVRQAEIYELRNTSMDVKARQLAVLMASRNLFKESPDRESELEVVRARWALIRETLRD